MTEPLPKNIQEQLNQVREDIKIDAIPLDEVAQELTVLVLNAFNVGKNPNYQIISIE